MESYKGYYSGGDDPSLAGPKKLPTTSISDKWSEAGNYVADPDLIAAVDVAITLGRPLLITGEPGTGKSELARSVGYDLGLGEPLEFVIKSDTVSTDLFYRFDTMGRFNALKSNGGSAPEGGASGGAEKHVIEAAAYIAYEALGEAILKSRDPDEVAAYWPPSMAEKKHQEQRRSVVLIDEIDKAPRDVPNDILSEIDRLEFKIPEFSLELRQPVTVRADPRFRPIVIITSNLEKNLPDAFLRRCVFYHMKFPGDVQLDEILARRLGDLYDQHSGFVRQARGLFQHLRKPELRLNGKPPATAELLDWLFVLLESLPNGQLPDRLQDHPLFLASVRGTLLKNHADQGRAEELIQSWQDSTPG